MSRAERMIKTTPERVWDVLADGWLYPLWVVGASRIREVDDSWPEEGTQIHHSVGAWPALIDDATSVRTSHPRQLLELTARAWPVGEVAVSIELSASGAGTQVVIEEDVVSGPARVVPAPVRALGLKWRNLETLRRLAYLAERRP